MRDGRAYLAFLSDFWTTIWRDSATLSAIVGAQVEVLNRLYLQAVQFAAQDYVDDISLFREDFWHLIHFTEADRKTPGVNAFYLPVGTDYHRLPFLLNQMFYPDLILREDGDYTLSRETALDEGSQGLPRTLITFLRGDPLKPAFYPPLKVNPIRNVAGPHGLQAETLFFAPKSYTNENDLFALFGALVRIVQPTSEQYRKLVKGVMYIYSHGPLVGPLNAGLSLASGYPVAQDNERVISIITVGDHYIVTTVSLTGGPGNIYEIPIAGTLAIGIGTVLKPLDTFISDILVMDYLTHPEWWKGGPGNLDPALRVVNQLPVDIVPSMPNHLRDDPATIDYLMDKYLKYNLLGLRVNTLAITTFNAIEDFYRVLYEVKPHYVSPYTNAYFKPQEIVDVPLDGLEDGESSMSSTIELTTHQHADDPGDAQDRWRFRRRLLMNGNLRLGPRLKDLQGADGTAWDYPRLTSSIEPIDRNAIMGSRVLMNSRRRLGSYPDGGLSERLTIASRIELDDTLGAAIDSCQIIGAIENLLGAPGFVLGAPTSLGGPPSSANVTLGDTILW